MADIEPDPAMVLLARGVIAILDSWPALRIAVEEGWGGPDAAQKCILLASEVVDSFESVAPKLPGTDDIEELLLNAILEEFQCEIDDDSSPVISRKIVTVAKDILEGRGEEVISRLEQIADRFKRSKIHSVAQKGEADSDSDDSGEYDQEMDEAEEFEVKDYSRQPSGTSPEVDDDGFTVVKGGRRK